MDDLLLVRILNGIAKRTKKFQAFGDREMMCVAVTIERLPFDKLHHEVRETIGSRTAVKEARDVRMVEGREDLSFFAESPQHEIRVHAALHQLNRDSKNEFVVDADGFVNGAHATSADFAFNPIRAQTPAD